MLHPKRHRSEAMNAAADKLLLFSVLLSICAGLDSEYRTGGKRSLRAEPGSLSLVSREEVHQEEGCLPLVGGARLFTLYLNPFACKKERRLQTSLFSVCDVFWRGEDQRSDRPNPGKQPG